MKTFLLLSLLLITNGMLSEGDDSASDECFFGRNTQNVSMPHDDGVWCTEDTSAQSGVTLEPESITDAIGEQLPTRSIVYGEHRWRYDLFCVDNSDWKQFREGEKLLELPDDIKMGLLRNRADGAIRDTIHIFKNRAAIGVVPYSKFGLSLETISVTDNGRHMICWYEGRDNGEFWADFDGGFRSVSSLCIIDLRPDTLTERGKDFGSSALLCRLVQKQKNKGKSTE